MRTYYSKNYEPPEDASGEYLVIYSSGTKIWYLNGKYHREDGPAILWNNGNKHWYLNGKLHRKDGPAIVS